MRAENSLARGRSSSKCPAWLPAYRVQAGLCARVEGKGDGEMRLSGSDYRADRARHVLFLECDARHHQIQPLYR